MARSIPSKPAEAETILYFCYGPQQNYDQAIFAILSALHLSGEGAARPRIAVYCDRPAAFAALPVDTVAVTEAMLADWLGGSDYIHRRKTCVIIDALARWGGKLIFLDTDTYWTRAPTRLFARIGPGRSCFHLLEGFLQSTGTPFDAALAKQLAVHDYRLSSGEPVVLDARVPMWNTGVVGMHADDAPLLHEAMRLSDAIWADADPDGPYGRKIHHAEQFAMGYVFRRQRLRGADDCVYHYWPQVAKASFGARLPGLTAPALAAPSPATIARAYAGRYRETGAVAWIDRGKMRVRQLGQALSLPVRGVRRSV